VKKSLPVLIGLMAGVILAIYLLCQPAEAIPAFFRFRVERFSAALHRLWFPSSDPMGAVSFYAPISVLFCALPGALLGFGVGALLQTMRRYKI
jgi:hypothetical protein